MHGYRRTIHDENEYYYSHCLLPKGKIVCDVRSLRAKEEDARKIREHDRDNSSMWGRQTLCKRGGMLL